MMTCFSKQKKGYSVMSLICFVLSFLSGFVYLGFYHDDTKYFSLVSVILPIVGSVLFALLVLFELTREYASLVLFSFDLLGIGFFIHAIYLYFSEVFYSGFSFDKLGDISVGFYVSFVFFFLSTLLSNILFYMRPKMKEEVK